MTTSEAPRSFVSSLPLLIKELPSCKIQRVKNKGVAIRRYTKSRNVSIWIKDVSQWKRLSALKDVRANCYCASLLRMHMDVMDRARALAIATGLLGFNDLERSVTLRFFQKQILFTIIFLLFKNEQKQCGELKKNSRLLSTGHGILPSCGCRAREAMVAKCELAL